MKKKQGKTQKVITIIRAKGKPDEVTVLKPKEAQTYEPMAQPVEPERLERRKPIKLPQRNVRITPKTPRLR